MPEFEEPENPSSHPESYTPSKDAKPRTRRRSGGFKTEPPSKDVGFGEVDPAKALKEEKLSGAAKPAKAAKKEKPAREAKTPRTPQKPISTGQAKPSKETLAAIERVEARIAEQRKERDARRAERDKNRPAKSGSRPTAKDSSGKPAQKSGLVASILSFFGLGPKKPASRPSGRSGGGSRESRPRDKGGSGGKRPGQNRSGGNRSGNRSGKGGGQNRRRSGGKGPRRSDSRRSSKQNAS